MANKKDVITGIIECENGNICFFEKDYVFTFMKDKLDHKNCRIEPKDGFIYGKTHYGHNIAIPYNSTIDCRSVATLKHNMYIFNNGNVQEDTEITNYRSIMFKGGTLNSLKRCDALKHNRAESKDNKIVYEAQNNSLKFNFNFGDVKCNVTIFSGIREYWGVKGTGINNQEIILIIDFDKEQPLDSIPLHIGRVKQILSILTFRKNVGFDEIKIDHNNTNVSTIFLNDEKPFTEKDYFRTINFDQVESCASKLFEVVYNLKENKYNYDFNFIPENDLDANYYNSDKIRNIASALECEMEFIKWPKNQNDDLKCLKKSVKDIVKKHEAENTSLEERTYTAIYNSISHWSMSEIERIWHMFLQYEEAMCVLLDCTPTQSKSYVEKFVKHRNGTTHGRHHVLDYEIVDIAYALSGLVYCFFLNRVGFPKDEIAELFRRGFLS